MYVYNFPLETPKSWMNIGDVEENYKYAKVVQKTWKITAIFKKN